MAMDNGQRLHQALTHYFALQQHQGEASFTAQLQRLQRWQIQRLLATHRPALNTPAAEAAAHFLFHQVYGGAHLYAVAEDIRRATNKAMALLPQAVMHTAAVTLEAAVLTQQLDEALCINLPLSKEPLQVNDYAIAYRATCTAEQRQRQLALIEEATALIDRYVRKPLLLASFRMLRRPAYAARLMNLYDFLDQGFQALSGLPSVSPLIVQLTNEEHRISQRLFAAQPDPFNGVSP